jgi:uncharacterized protein DUF6768
MSEFSELLKEAFFSDESFDASPGREALLQAVRGYDRRMRLVRFMVWFTVLFFGGVTIACVVALWGDTTATPTRGDLFLVALGLWGILGVGFAKFWFQDMLNHNRVMKELKRTQLALLDRQAE